MSVTHVNNRSIKRLSTRGFTLIELMVSLAVFSVVMTISVGTLLVMVDLNAKAQALYSATTNLSFALDSMAREIRTGYHYYCDAALTGQLVDIVDKTSDCNGGSFIAFIREEDGAQMAYQINGEALEQRIIETDGTDSMWMPITAGDVVVTSFEITVRNPNTHMDRGTDNKGSTTDENQPVVDLGVRGYVENGLDTETDFFIQTRITQRRLDIL